MKALAEKISDSELEVMRLLWRSEEPLTTTAIRESLQRSIGWEATTIKTLIQRLHKKGILAQEKKDVFYYRPLVSEKEYNEWATGDLVQKLYGGKARNLVAALVDSKGLSKEDLDELRAMFRVEE